MTDTDEQLTVDEELETWDEWIRSLSVDQNGKRADQPPAEEEEEWQSRTA